MAAVFPVPTGRTSDLLLQKRLLAQFQFEQRSLLRLQDQLATGRRITAPSQDAPAALRGMLLQRLIEQKDQAGRNLETSDSFLSASENSLAGVADLLIDIRGQVLSASDSTSGSQQREAVAEEVRRAIQELVQVGNREFRGRYLFGGTRVDDVPFVFDGPNVLYQGNEQHLRSYADLNLLFETNVTGAEVFGAVSAEVLGSADVNPALSSRTRLDDLNGGLGVSAGSILISDGQSERVVDLSRADSVADVVALIEANPPAGRKVAVRVQSDHLQVGIDGSGASEFSIIEVGAGTTAAELGILRPRFAGVGTIVGTDLNPRVTLTTRVEDLLGSRASAVVVSENVDNDLIFRARNNGAEQNGVTIQFVDDDLLQAAPGVTAGSEKVTVTETALRSRAALSLTGSNNNLIISANAAGPAFNNVEIEVVDAGLIGDAAQVLFNPSDRLLTIGIDSANRTRVQTLINAVQGQGSFSVAYDDSDPGDGGFDPNALVPASSAGVVRGNTGNSGTPPNTILIHLDAGHSKASQVLAALQSDAVVNDRFEVSLDSKDTEKIAGNGIVDLNATAVTENGAGGDLDAATGLQVSNGERTTVLNFTDAETVEDLLNVFNGAELGLLASINAAGTGLDVRSRLSGGDLRIGENGGAAATQLGIRTLTEQTVLSQLNHGRGVSTVAGTDFTVRRPDGTELAIDVSGALTVGEVIQRINQHVDNQDPATAIVARLAQVGNGIELSADDPAGGQPIEITRAATSTAGWELGLIAPGEEQSQTTAAAEPATARLTFFPSGNNSLLLTANQPGTGLNDVQIQFVADSASGNQALVSFDPSARILTVDIDPGTTTAAVVAGAITFDGNFSASLDTQTDPSNDGSGTINQVGVLATTAGGAAERLTGEDVRGIETRGIFNTLIRLQQALGEFDLPEIERTMAMLDLDTNQLNFVRAEVGARQRSLDVLRGRLDAEDVELRDALSKEIDVDLVEAISDLTARQASLEATLRLVGQTFQLSLLQFL